jgi:hypothetical protein
MMVGMSHAGYLCQVKQCITNTFDPNITILADQVTEHILQYADHMDDHVGDPLATLHGPPFATAFLLALYRTNALPRPVVAHHSTNG